MSSIPPIVRQVRAGAGCSTTSGRHIERFMTWAIRETHSALCHPGTREIMDSVMLRCNLRLHKLSEKKGLAKKHTLNNVILKKLNKKAPKSRCNVVLWNMQVQDCSLARATHGYRMKRITKLINSPAFNSNLAKREIFLHTSGQLDPYVRSEECKCDCSPMALLFNRKTPWADPPGSMPK